MTRISVDQLYMEIAFKVAQRSTCARRAVGCVLVDAHDRILSFGYNGVASGMEHCNEGFHCPGVGAASGTHLDDCHAIHAEQNAILQLSDPYAVKTAYVTVSPCTPCMKLLLGTSCRRIVAGGLYADSSSVALWKHQGRVIDIFQ